MWKTQFRAEPIRALKGPGLPLFSFKPAWFFEKPAGFRKYPADFTTERRSGNGTIPAAEPERDQTVDKPGSENNPGPKKARISPFFPETDTVFSESGMVSYKPGGFYVKE
jgi:hypothetical protein